MSNNIRVLEFLDDLKPQRQCDDCLSTELDILPRQTVNQICRALEEAGRIARLKSRCDRCGKVKIANFYRTPTASVLNSTVDAVTVRSTVSRRKTNDFVLDIEKARTEVVRICRMLWNQNKSADPPRGLARLIIELRNDGILPVHVANMMQTVSGLRNVHVYEGIELHSEEMAVAVNARAIFIKWWSNRLNSS